MSRHRAQQGPEGIGEAPAEVTLERVSDALRGLGLEPMDAPDRLVVSAPSYVTTVWISHEKPLTLVADCQQRIPVEFEHGSSLARFLDTWNHDRVGPVASYRLTDSGDIDVRLRSGVLAKFGLSDEQLFQELTDSFEHMAAFSLALSEKFLPMEFDHPLPPTLVRAQDTDALLGPHPSGRHLPRGGERDVVAAPDEFSRSFLDGGSAGGAVTSTVDSTVVVSVAVSVTVVGAASVDEEEPPAKPSAPPSSRPATSAIPPISAVLEPVSPCLPVSYCADPYCADPYWVAPPGASQSCPYC